MGDQREREKKIGGVPTPRRRTRNQWNQYYHDVSKELRRKRKDQQSGGVGEACKRVKPEPIYFDMDDDDIVEVSKSAEKDDYHDDGAEILRNRVDDGSEPKGVVVDNVVEGSRSDENNDDDDDNGAEILRNREYLDCGFEPRVVGVDTIFEEPKVVGINEVSRSDVKDGDDNGAKILRNCEYLNVGFEPRVVGVDTLFEEPKVVGVEDAFEVSRSAEKDDDDNDIGAEILRYCECLDVGFDSKVVGIDTVFEEPKVVGINTVFEEPEVVGIDDAFEVSRSIEKDDDDDDNGAEILRSDGDDTSGGDENGIEFLYEKIGSNGSCLRNEAELIDKCECSGEDADHIEPHVDSDSSKEDSDGSDEPVSESEPTSEDESESVENDRLSDEDYKGEEESSTSVSSTSESSSDDSETEVVKDAEYAVAENENLMKSEGKNLRKESDDNQEKDDGSDENVQESDCEIGKVKKRKRVNVERESGADLERNGGYIDDEKVEEEAEEEELPIIKKSARKNQKEVSQKSEKGEIENGSKCSSSKNNDSRSLNNKIHDFFTGVKIRGDQCSVKKVFLGSEKSSSPKELDLIKILVDSINTFKEKQYNINENALSENAPPSKSSQNALPLRFRFEDEDMAPPVEKSEWEKHLDSLFCDLELGLRESEYGCTNNDAMEVDEVETTVEVDESPAACCRRGKHHEILDDEIGIICKYCHTVIMDIKHVLPPLRTPSWDRRRDRRYYYDEFQTSFFNDIQFEGSACAAPDSTSCTKGTVWDLIPGTEKELYPHQREGFEFMWRNIAGDTIIEKLKQTLGDDARGCIMSHAPGTGKTRLTIVFLQSFLKLYPTCSPMIIAPKVMLLTWEAEFKKWNFNAAFHNLNKKDLSGMENTVAAELLGLVENGKLSKDCIRLLKLYSWARGGSILGISYQLFEKLARENGKGEQHEKIREVLLERTGLLVLDEGHTPRNDKSLIWKALTKVQTQRRIILSGTPFQNNLKELYNTLCVVNPKFANQETITGCEQTYTMARTRRRWKKLANSTGINRGDALKLRAVLDPYVHVHNGTILEKSLPGLSHTLVFLAPTESQKTLLQMACKEEFLRRIRMVSLISVHPSIDAVTKRYSTRRDRDTKLDIDAGVKAMFLFKLIHFAGAYKERVLVFSQFVDSLTFIKEQLMSMFSWREGREVLYMDGQLDDRKRQESISCFNDETSEAKVFLATERACSEGINLIGASRVVLLDTVWNPSVEKQAISRAYRIGQKKVVYVYRLFTSGMEVRQFAQQIYKKQISEWLFALGEEQACRREKARAVMEDKLLDAMLDLDGFNNIFEDIISQPKESDLIAIFGLEEHN